MATEDIELLAIGAGPSNLALAVALEELAPEELATSSMIVEQHEDIVWQREMLLPWARTQVSFLKDLVTLRNPRSSFTFLNYLHSVGRLDQFVNLGTFNPYRQEISDYLQWVAKSLTKPRIEYGRRCSGIEPVVGPDGGVERWRVTFANETTITCRNLVIGVGREPNIPEMFATLPRERVVHSTEFCSRLAELSPDQPHRIVVVGAAQSAAEMLWSSHQQLPLAECTMVTRAIGLRSYEHSKFTNELYYPSFVNEFYSAPPDIRAQVFGEMRATNYSAMDPELLDTLYRQMYEERLNRTERLAIVTSTDIVGTRMDGDEIVLSLVDRKTGRTEEVRCDVVMLGTGFSRQMPGLIRAIADAVGVDEVAVTRNYRMQLPEKSAATCHLQGVNEATHGIADSLLSVLAVRSAEILHDVLSVRTG